ncbi:hypothetical protein SAMN04489724_3014 [Algoriphagus locisalis]|uniref:Uncharacterized protein n=1 Tax=Algoriphagus locisalis TaxID=305507 RepID=A0A1I7CAK9_9BACT|nr:hypothetical protein [Algoriphagus locisalis]SFT96465.1 hypothetical protein SAMN04489724_3014 [Algoriphagus locisalis]
MRITIHQAICGEKNKSWDLLKTTLEDSNQSKNIALKTDIQDTAGGQKWLPTIRGFGYGEYFLVMRSFLDVGDVRPGRAFSHVLILAFKDMLKISNLLGLFDLIPNQISKDADLQPIVLDESFLLAEIDSESYTEPFRNRFSKLIYGYIQLLEYKNTLLWVGDTDYELAVAELWKRLTDEERSKFEFGIYFNPVAIPKNKLNLITIASKNTSRFLNSGFLLVDVGDKIELTGIAERLLMGEKNLNAGVEEFAKAIGVRDFERQDWNTMSIGLKTFENFQNVFDFKKLKTFAHIVSKFSPSPKNGASFKRQIVDRLALVLKDAPADEVALFNQIDTKPFSSAKASWKESFSTWLEVNIFITGKVSNENIRILSALEKPNAKGWWHETLQNKVEGFFSLDDFDASIVYDWIEAEPKIFTLIKQFIKKENESAFGNVLHNKLKPSTIQLLKTYAKENNWYVLYAKILLLEFSVSEALVEQLKIDKNTSSLKGITEILKDCSGKEIVRLALLNKDTRLLSLAATHCKSDPAILNSIDLALPFSQQVWMEAIWLGNGLDTGFLKFKAVTHKLFDMLITGNAVLPDIIEKIGNSKYANISSYKNRAQLWDKLPSASRTRFLKSTSAALLEELSKGKTVSLPEDPVLSKYIFENAINDFFYFNSKNLKSIIPILRKYRNIPNDYLDTYLRNFRERIDGAEAKSLGKLVNERNAFNSASIIYHLSEKNNSWSIALKECYSLLSFGDKAKIFLLNLIPNVKISTNQWWDNAHDIISNYYSNPVSLVRIWTRAGGHESDLVLTVSAKETWEKALAQLKRGEFKSITMNSLLKEINKEYGEVDGFKLLFNIRKSHI